MKIKELMTSSVTTCHLNTNLAAAAMLMWEKDCGAVPVVNDEHKVIGMITDRDICMAVATKHRPAEHITVNEVIQGNVLTCNPDEEINEALDHMSKHKVRRIPVVDKKGQLLGIVSINDVVLASKEKGKKEPTHKEVVNVLKSICDHPARNPSS